LGLILSYLNAMQRLTSIVLPLWCLMSRTKNFIARMFESKLVGKNSLANK